MSQKLQNFVKFQKFQLENLVDFEKCCKTHILNYYFLAKIGADTAENEQHFAETLPTDAVPNAGGASAIRCSTAVDTLPREFIVQTRAATETYQLLGQL